MKAREVKRAKLVARYAEKRAALKKIIATAEDPAEAYEAARKLQAIPKNANPIRLHNQPHPSAQPLQDHGSSEGIHPPVRPFAYSVP